MKAAYRHNSDFYYYARLLDRNIMCYSGNRRTSVMFPPVNNVPEDGNRCKADKHGRGVYDQSQRHQHRGLTVHRNLGDRDSSREGQQREGKNVPSDRDAVVSSSLVLKHTCC